MIAVGLRPQLFAVCQDEEFARVLGLPVRAYAMLIAVMAAVTVTVAMRTVGLLLVSALMVVPVATAQQLTRGFRATLALALALGVLPSLAGVVFSFYVDVAPGASIVVIALLGFALAWPVGSLIQRRRYLARSAEADARLAGDHVAAEQHGHQHDEHCGHPASAACRLPARWPPAPARSALRRTLRRAPADASPVQPKGSTARGRRSPSYAYSHAASTQARTGRCGGPHRPRRTAPPRPHRGRRWGG